MEPIVERRPEYNGWEIREADQPPGTGMVVTDGWLAVHGFTRPSRFNIEKIVMATMAAQQGYKAMKVDPKDVLHEGMTTSQFYVPKGLKK